MFYNNSLLEKRCFFSPEQDSGIGDNKLRVERAHKILNEFPNPSENFPFLFIALTDKQKMADVNYEHSNFPDNIFNVPSNCCQTQIRCFRAPQME